MPGIIRTSDRFFSKVRTSEFHHDDSSENCGVSVSSSITTRTPFILQRLRQHLKESSETKDCDRLNFEALSLYGRDKELEILNKCLDRLSSGVVQRQLILISGESGTGKTALAHSLETPTTKLNGLFVGGKFDFNNRHEPYSGIVRACVEICDHILSLQEQNLALFQKVSQHIKDGLGSELSLLNKFIPALKGVIDFQEEDPSLLVVCSSSEEATNRFRFAFQRFIRIVSDSFAPLVLVLDDLQWSDVSSLDLLDISLSDPRTKNFLIIGTYRSSDVDETHVLNEAIARLRTKCDGVELEMTILLIDNLDIQDMNKIISVLLSVDDDATTMDLTKVCYKKTQGNPFFVIQFLQMVRNNGLLKYDSFSLSWKWNCDEINSCTKAASNVVDVLKAKMANLPNHLLEILKVASCLGYTFNEKWLRIILESSSSLPRSLTGDCVDSLECGLEELEQHGYIIKRNSDSSLPSSQSFSWTHDKIQEAAIMLLPVEERAKFLSDAGDILISKLSSSELESAIFVLAKLLNAGKAPAPNDEKRLAVAYLNHDASIRALSISAFESVARYAGKGISMLPDNHWNEHYQLSLGLYSAAAQAEGFLGNFDLMWQYCNVVLSQKERPLRDKMWVYNTLVNSIIGKGQLEEASDLIFSILSICNCHFPVNPLLIRVALVKNAAKIKSVMKRLDPQSLAKCNDRMIVDLTQLMDKLLVCLYMKKDARMPLVTLRILDWTMKHGYSDYSSNAFAAAAIFLTGYLGNFHDGDWYGQHALKLIEKSKSPGARCRTMSHVCALVFIWTKPVAQLLDPIQQSFHEGMNSGDQSLVALSVLCILSLRFIAGNSLVHIEPDIRHFSKLMKNWKVTIQMDMLKCVHQATLNLMGYPGQNSAVLLGEVFNDEDYRRCSQDDNVSALQMAWEGKLLTLFGDHVQHATKTIQHGHDYLQKRFPSHPRIASDTFMKGVSCFAAARETGKAKYSKMGERLRSKIKRWCRMGNPNVVHFDSFLDAESAVLKGKKTDAIMNYEISIGHADRFGFIQDAAFASERLAELHLETGNEMEAGYHMGQAVGYWRAWGAIAKVEALEKKYGYLCHGPLANATLVIKTKSLRQNGDDIVV